MYCTKQDLIDRFSEQELIELTDHSNLGVINDSKLTQAMMDASAEMEIFIGSRYELPLVNVPKALLPLACDITRYKLYDQAVSDHVAERYKSAIEFLRSVAKGAVTLGVNVNGDSAVSSDFAEMQSAGSVFSRENSKGFI